MSGLERRKENRIRQEIYWVHPKHTDASPSGGVLMEVNYKLGTEHRRSPSSEHWAPERKGSRIEGERIGYPGSLSVSLF